jgi:integrase
MFKNEQLILDCVSRENNEKHRTILFLVYCYSPRAGEVVRLKIEDIDSSRMLIHIEQGKGRKDRITILSEGNLKLLRDYFKYFSPRIGFFPVEKMISPLQHVVLRE